jgi:hypothetical protein
LADDELEAGHLGRVNEPYRAGRRDPLDDHKPEGELDPLTALLLGVAVLLAIVHANRVERRDRVVGQDAALRAESSLSLSRTAATAAVRASW